MHAEHAGWLTSASSRHMSTRETVKIKSYFLVELDKQYNW